MPTLFSTKRDTWARFHLLMIFWFYFLSVFQHFICLCLWLFYGLSHLPPTSYFVFICFGVRVFGVVRLWDCGVMSLSVCGSVFCVCCFVYVCVFEFVCAPCVFAWLCVWLYVCGFVGSLVRLRWCILLGSCVSGLCVWVFNACVWLCACCVCLLACLYVFVSFSSR